LGLLVHCNSVLVEPRAEVLKSFFESSEFVSEKVELIWGDSDNWRLWNNLWGCWSSLLIRELDIINALFLLSTWWLWNWSHLLQMNSHLSGIWFRCLNNSCMMNWSDNRLMLDSSNLSCISSSNRSSCAGSHWLCLTSSDGGRSASCHRL